MDRTKIDRTRYRSLLVALALMSVACLAGMIAVLQRPTVHAAEWLSLLAGAVFCLACYPPLTRGYRRHDRAAIERVILAVFVVCTLVVLQRLAWGLYGPLIRDPSRFLFRPTYAFMPFMYLGAFAVLRARMALRVSWLIWALVTALTLPALYFNTGLDLKRDGELMLLVWMLLGNPLFILMMYILPQYEDALDRSAAELDEVRGRNELLEQLAVSEQRFDLVVDGLQVGVWDRVIAPDGSERRWWSPRFYELIGHTPGELPPSEEALKSLMHPEDRRTVWERGTAQLRHGQTMDIEFRLLTRDAGYRWFNSRAKAVRDGQGRMIRIAGAIADVHDRKMAEQALQEAKQEMTRLAYRDTLTDLHNRRSFDEEFKREWERARRYERPLSLVVMDLDHFKAYNDRYGHAAGDRCLIELARLVKLCLHRPADSVARLGGEEFAILLPETHAAGALEVAQRVGNTLRAASLPHESAPRGIVTASIGAATASPDGAWPATPSVLFEQADQALYRVKRQGRDGVLHFAGLDDAAGSVSAA
ncbi:MAG TPA: diguanylate cyclase [Candidatus Binatia bacterium]|nr:diguanylate cyclase [Candidatus Binatia bacterium]